jgi:hypothetical protein
LRAACAAAWRRNQGPIALQQACAKPTGSAAHGIDVCSHAGEDRRAVGTGGGVVFLERFRVGRVERSHDVRFGDFVRIGWAGAFGLLASV